MEATFLVRFSGERWYEVEGRASRLALRLRMRRWGGGQQAKLAGLWCRLIQADDRLGEARCLKWSWTVTGGQ